MPEPSLPEPSRSGPDTPEPPLRSPARPAPYWAAGAMIAVAIFFPLLVPSFAKKAPALAGFPFFYWYQLLWVFLAAGLLSIALSLVTREDRRRREEARRGRPDQGSDPAVSR